MAKRKKKSKRKILTEKLDGLIRQIIRLRDDNQCQKCGKAIEGSDSHPHHIEPKGNGASLRRFDLLNIILLCFNCHRWCHDNTIGPETWFREKYPARYDYLEIYRGGKPCPISEKEMEDLVETCKQKLIGLGE